MDKKRLKQANKEFFGKFANTRNKSKKAVQSKEKTIWEFMKTMLLDHKSKHYRVGFPEVVSIDRACLDFKEFLAKIGPMPSPQHKLAVFCPYKEQYTLQDFLWIAPEIAQAEVMSVFDKNTSTKMKEAADGADCHLGGIF